MPKQKLPPVFKEYTMGQIVLLPRDLEEEIEPNHLVRVVHAVIEKMDLRVILPSLLGSSSAADGEGGSSRHNRYLDWNRRRAANFGGEVMSEARQH